MRADNVVLLFILAWTFMAACFDLDDEFSVSCENVRGFVRKEVILTCSVTLLKTHCCIRLYKFQYPERFNNSAICREELPDDSCDQRNSFSCSYTPPEVMTERFRFTVQADCETKRAEFTVSITESSQRKDHKSKDGSTNGFNDAVIPSVLGLSVILILIIILITIIYVRRFKSTGVQENHERGVSEEQTVMTTNV